MIVRVAMAVLIGMSCLAPGHVRGDDAMPPSEPAAPTAPAAPVAPVTLGDGGTAYIISADYAAGHKADFLSDLTEFHKVIDFWTPTPDEIIVAERVFRQWIQDGARDPTSVYPEMAKLPQNFPPGEPEFEQNEMALIDQNYSRYTRQYAGLIIRGRRVILCNYFTGLEADPSTGYVFKRKVFAENKDIHFVQAWYDPDARTCSNLVMVGLWQKKHPKF
jgi:hypothetical protein